ncbi:unnamed protein product [Ambrosiozyma monospora]|uniref:Unnamed protein product n=1 Tax=Ambrosiozyma monospora TaxID=43982 RepID=A0ACB5SX65_AMBMO|nr:unnamed protein product [Ambrosiozyma monospora]
MDKQAWIPKNDSKKIRLEEDDEEFDDAVEQFENAYNFRFEDPHAADLVSYARSQATMRREKANSRKRERQQKQEAARKEKDEKNELLKKKKQKKMNQVMDRIKEIKQAVGDEVPEEVIIRVFGDSLLKDDFDDSEWDSKMAEIFNDEYYASETVKPEWNDEDDEIMGEFNKNKKAKETEGSEEEGLEEKQENDVTSEQKSEEQKSKKSKKKEAKHEKKKGKEKLKDVAEKLVTANTLQLLDEVEEERGRKKSKSEEVKFKYREVSPESFGLTTREIFLADDNDLNEFIGIKKFAPYREKAAQLKDKRKYAKKKRLRDWRLKVFHNPDGPQVEEGEEDIIKIPSIVNEGKNRHHSRKSDKKHKSKKQKTK